MRKIKERERESEGDSGGGLIVSRKCSDRRIPLIMPHELASFILSLSLYMYTASRKDFISYVCVCATKEEFYNDSHGLCGRCMNFFFFFFRRRRTRAPEYILSTLIEPRAFYIYTGYYIQKSISEKFRVLNQMLKLRCKFSHSTPLYILMPWVT